MIELSKIKITWRKKLRFFQDYEIERMYKRSLTGPNIWFALYLIYKLFRYAFIAFHFTQSIYGLFTSSLKVKFTLAID